MHFQTTFSSLLALGVTIVRVSAYPRHGSRANVCYEDNALRALERYSAQAAAFCPKYLSSPGIAVPSQIANLNPSRITSACKCFEKTAGTLAPTVATSKATSVTKTQPTPTVSSKTSVSTIPSSTSTTMNLSMTTSAKTTASSKISSTSSSTTSLPTTVQTGGANNGVAKRGLVYDYNSKTTYGDMFKGSKHISFGSNWGSKRAIGNSVTLDNSFAFIPTLRVDGGLINNDWVNDATAAIKSGSQYLFSSNEPDNAGQANLTPDRAAQVYKKYMNQFAGQAKLATPAVTNGGGATGLNWLDKFVGSCDGCHFDVINIHHYVQRSQMTVDQAVAALKSYIEKDVPALQAKHTQLQGLPIMIGEFWLWDASDAEGGTYLEKILPYLDGNDAVVGYQAFGGLWTGNFISGDGKSLTPAGTAYRG